jgi:hypothetical protein
MIIRSQAEPTTGGARLRVATIVVVGVLTLAGAATATGAEEAQPPLRRPDGWRQKAAGGAEQTRSEPVAPGKSVEKSGGKPTTGDAAAPRKDQAAKDQPAALKPEAGRGNPEIVAEKAALDKVGTKTTIEEILARALPPRSDRAVDWQAGLEPLHRCGEPRWIEPCIPLPPCHPALPPHPYDLIGVVGDPTCGPIYRGPCCPRSGTHANGPWPRVHGVYDRLFDAFYLTK